MFKPKTDKIAVTAQSHQKVLKELGTLLRGNVYMYIDHANVRPWADKLKWHIDPKRLKQFIDSFDNIQEIKFYIGTLIGDEKSEGEIKQIQDCGYCLRTKPVKIMKFSIKAAGISTDNSSLLAQFIRIQKIRDFICWKRELLEIGA
ncbi:MAG: hypothetical protein NTZ80_03590 [Patescibacteria group bacterium]|nr:hypothetical protein [Patescibacteria group bacterium]